MATSKISKPGILYKYLTITITDATEHLGLTPHINGYRAIACQSYQNVRTVGTRRYGDDLEVQFSGGALNSTVGCYVTYVAVNDNQPYTTENMMATSTIKHNRDLVLFTGTIPDATGDYTISNFFPTTTYIPIAAFYRTSYSQFRPVSVGFLPGDSRGVVLIGLTESMKGRDLRVYALPIV